MNNLVPSFKNTLFDNNKKEIGEITELIVDSIIKDGALRDVPIVGTINDIIKITQNINHRNLLKQTLQFIEEFNNGTIDESKLLEYKKLINENKEKAEEELGRVLLLLNSTLELEKTKMLANLYRNYVNKNISWSEFCEYSEIIRMIMISDIDFLQKIFYGKIKETTNYPLYPFNRLNALGLVEISQKELFPMDSDIIYIRSEERLKTSEFGSKFNKSIIIS